MARVRELIMPHDAGRRARVCFFGFTVISLYSLICLVMVGARLPCRPAPRAKDAHIFTALSAAGAERCPRVRRLHCDAFDMFGGVVRASCESLCRLSI